MDILVLTLTLKNKGKEDTSPPTFLIKRLSIMPLLEVKYTNSVN